MACQHLRPVPLSLSDHADVGPDTQKLRGSELAEGEDRAVEVEIRMVCCSVKGIE